MSRNARVTGWTGIRGLVPVALLLAAATLAPGAGAASRDELTVATRNLYFGTDLGPVIAAPTPTEFFTRVAAALEQSRATDFQGRAAAWASEIDATRPDLIGLQEAVLWQTQTPADFSTVPNATTVEADFVELLLAELRSRGLQYALVKSQTGYDVEAPGLFATGFTDVRLTQREVILARKNGGVKLSNAQGGQYAARISIPTVVGTSIELPWAWASVDGTVGGRSFRFITTHLDPLSGVAQRAQAAEMLAGPANTSLPVIWLGDFNSDAEGTVVTGVIPATATYSDVIAAGFTDAWATKHPADPGFTCCQDTDLRNPTPSLETRVDLVMIRGGLGVEEATIVGEEVGDRLPSGLWPSDHAGVTVTLELERD